MGTLFLWDGRMPTLEDQILDPVQHPDEMNLPWSQAVQRLQDDEPGGATRSCFSTRSAPTR